MSALGAVALGLGSAIAGGASFPLIDRLMNGSLEDQMRRQAAVQEQIENERMARQSGAGNPDMAGLVGGRVSPMDLESLIAEDELTNQGSRLARKLYKARSARNPLDDRLAEILGESTARIAAIQSERVLTPIEIIQMMEMAGG
jgi:hypothetical protein